MTRLGVLPLVGLLVGSEAWASEPLDFVPEPSVELPSAIVDETIVHHPGASRIIYVNGDGGLYTAGYPNDSRVNRSSILDSDHEAPAFPYDEAVFDSAVECLRDIFAPYDVYVTTQDPGTTDHMEIVMTGLASEVGLPEYGGVSPFTCNLIENSIVWVFAIYFGRANPQLMCERAAHEAGHSLGLEHSRLCTDVMTYLDDCGNKIFEDAAAQCGEYEPRDCFCRGKTQNSHQHLLEVLGPHPKGLAPSIVIESPEDGSIVPPGFPVRVSASDEDGFVEAVHLFLDGEYLVVDYDSPYEFVAPDPFADGEHLVEARATDDWGQRATDSVTVFVEEGRIDGGVTDDAGLEARLHRSDGCGCRAAGPAPGWLAIAGTPFLVARRRRSH